MIGNNILCLELKELLMQVALDEASAEERSRVEKHLAGCQACHQVFAEWKLTRKLVAEGLPQEDPPQRIRFVDSRRSVGGFGGWVWQRAFTIPVGIAAGIALIVCALALSGARASLGAGGWQVALGRPSAGGVTSGSAAVPAAQDLTRAQVAELVAAAVRESEQHQRAETARFVETAIGHFDRRQQVALRDLSMQVALFDRNQNYFYKQNEGTQFALQAIEKRLPAETGGLQ